jgi:hypothetical protein
VLALQGAWPIVLLAARPRMRDPITQTRDQTSTHRGRKGTATTHNDIRQSRALLLLDLFSLIRHDSGAKKFASSVSLPLILPAVVALRCTLATLSAFPATILFIVPFSFCSGPRRCSSIVPIVEDWFGPSVDQKIRLSDDFRLAALATGIKVDDLAETRVSKMNDFQALELSAVSDTMEG